MRNGNESDVVAELTATASTSFSNWLNSDYKEEFIYDCHRIQDGEMTPGQLRWAIKIAYEAGWRRGQLERMNG